MKTIMILVYLGRSIATAEFDDEVACKSAAKEMERIMNSTSAYLVTYCAPKAILP